MRNITIINHVKLRPNALREAESWFVDWKAFLSKVTQCKDIEVLLINEDTFYWLEHWKSKDQLEKFIREHLIYTGHISRMTEFAYTFDRDIYKKIN